MEPKKCGNVKGEVVEHPTQGRVKLGANLLDERRVPSGLHPHGVRRLLLRGGGSGIGVGDGGSRVAPDVFG